MLALTLCVPGAGTALAADPPPPGDCGPERAAVASNQQQAVAAGRKLDEFNARVARHNAGGDFQPGQESQLTAYDAQTDGLNLEGTTVATERVRVDAERKALLRDVATCLLMVQRRLEEQQTDERSALSGTRTGDVTVEPDVKMIDKLRDADRILRDSGVDARRILGDLPASSLARQRVAQVLTGTRFPGSVQKRAVAEASEWALRDAPDARAFADRFEFYKAVFDERARAARSANIRARSTEQVPRRVIDARELDTLRDGRTVDERLAAMSDAVRLLPARGLTVGPAATGRPEELLTRIRDGAGDATFGTTTAASYHVLKHGRELPERFRDGDAADVAGYFAALAEVLGGGTAMAGPAPGGGTRVTVDATVDGVPLRAILFVRPDGSVVVATFAAAR